MGIVDNTSYVSNYVDGAAEDAEDSQLWNRLSGLADAVAAAAANIVAGSYSGGGTPGGNWGLPPPDHGGFGICPTEEPTIEPPPPPPPPDPNRPECAAIRISCLAAAAHIAFRAEEWAAECISSQGC